MQVDVIERLLDRRITQHRFVGRNFGRFACQLLRREFVGGRYGFAVDVLVAAVGRAVTRSAPSAGAAIRLRLGVAMGALLLVDQRLPIGNGDLIVVGMDFAEGEEAVAITAVVDEGCL